MWDRLHRTVLDRLGQQGLLDWSRAGSTASASGGLRDVSYQVVRAYVAQHKPQIRAEAGRGRVTAFVAHGCRTEPRSHSSSLTNRSTQDRLAIADEDHRHRQIHKGPKRDNLCTPHLERPAIDR